MSETLNLNPPRFLLRGQGGNDFIFVIKLDFDATGAVHTIYLATKPDYPTHGDLIEILTDGAGLVSSLVSGKTWLTVTIDRSITLEHEGKSIFLSYDSLYAGVLRTKCTAKVVVRQGIHAN